MPAVLSQDQVDEFVERGFTLLRQGFSPEVAARCRDRIWTELAMRADAPESWTSEYVHMQRSFGDGAFAEISNPRLSGAFDDLLGAGRYVPLTHYGWWPVSFPGFAQPPWGPPAVGWHVDGQHFHHHIDGRDQGLLPLFIFSDIFPGDGGTAYIPCSHLTTARILAQAAPTGIAAKDISALAAAAIDPANGIEATGMPGDVLLLHPFMVHARSANTGPRVRMICNPCIGLNEPIRLGAQLQATPLERSIIGAIVKRVA